MYINYNTVGGIEYGTLTTSVRKGSKVGKGDQIYLGRVVDKERGIFKSRSRGLFTYDLNTNSFGKVPAEFIEPQKVRKTKYEVRPQLVVSFGDVFLPDQYISPRHFDKAIDEIDKTISHLEKVKKELLGSDNQLRIATNKVDDVSVKKLTRNNPTMRAKFEALSTV